MIERIDGQAFFPDLEMQVGTGGRTGLFDGGNNLAIADPLPGLSLDRYIKGSAWLPTGWIHTCQLHHNASILDVTASLDSPSRSPMDLSATTVASARLSSCRLF